MTDEPRRATGTAAPAWDWELLLPPGWVRLPTDAQQARRAVTALLDRRLAHLPRDAVAAGRRTLERELRARLAEARDAGAGDVFAQVDLVAGVPVSAGLTVARLAAPAEDGALLAGLVSVLGRSTDVVQRSAEQCAGRPALRRRRRFVRAVEDGLPALPQTGVDWVVSLPDSPDVLVLSFATASDPVADELVALFDAVACSLVLVERV